MLEKLDQYWFVIPLDHRGSCDRQTWREINDRVLDWMAVHVSVIIEDL